MFNKGKHQNVNSMILNLFTNKKILFGLLAVAIVAILIPTISFATEVMDAEGESLPEKVENAINEIIGEPATAPAAHNEDMSNYLCFTPVELGTETKLLLSKTGNPIGADIWYSTNGDSWNEVVPGQEITFDQQLYFKGNNPDGFSSSSSDYWCFDCSTYTYGVNASGNIMSLIDGGLGTTLIIPNNYCFYKLFDYARFLKTAPELPAKTLTDYCYYHMFSNSDLTRTPELPALNLKKYCYGEMFSFCNELCKVSELPAMILDDHCYYHMFDSCRFLQEGPSVLPAKELKDSSYAYMFSECQSLIKAPELKFDKVAFNSCVRMFNKCSDLVNAPEIPSVVPASQCYEGMFCRCTSLKRLVVNFDDWGSSNGTYDWLLNVTNSEECVFVCPEVLEVPSKGVSTVPDKWKIVHPMKLELSDNTVVYDGLEHGINIDTVYPDDATKEFSEDGTTWGSEIKKKDVGEYTVYCRISKTDFDPLVASAKIIITPNSDASVSFDGGPYTKKYGDKDPDFKMNFLGLATGDTPVINKDYTISRDEGEDVLPANGSYNVYFNWLNPNYLIDPLQTTLTINKATNAKLVADNYSRYSNESDPTKFPAHMEGLKFGDTLADADYNVVEVSDANAETITLRPSLTPAGIAKFSNNYDFDFVDGELNIFYRSDHPEFQFAVNADNCTYDGKEHEFKIDVISPQGLAKVEYSYDDGSTWQEDTFKFTQQGTYTVHYRINHDDFEQASGQADITIAPAQLTIVPDAAYKNLGEADPTLTAQVYGLAEGESLVPGVDYTLTRAQGEQPGVYDIYCNVNNGKLDNYSVTTGTSKFIIVSAGGNAENVEGSGASGAKTGDANFASIIAFGFIALVAGGYVALRKSRKSK